MMDGALSGLLSGLAARFLDQDQDLAYAFTGAAGAFTVVGFSAHEAINAPFEIHIELASEDSNIDLHALMDAPGVLGIYSKYDAPRFLHGVVTEAERGDSGIRRTFYRLTLRPALARLDHGTDSRHWQAKSVPDIVTGVLAEFGIPDVEWRLDAAHGPREFLCQYRETHRAFIERILAEEGIFYFFEHTESAHKLIFTDAPLATPVLPLAPEIGYNPRPGGQSRGSWISSFSQRERVRSSSYQMNDYTFHNPPANMKQKHVSQEDNGLAADYALYEFPGRYKDPSGVGDPFTKHRIESVRVDATTAQGQTNNIQLSPGFHFALTGHDDARANGLHRLLAVSHSGQQPTALQEDAGTGATTYSSSFTCMPGRLPYRPPLTRKPVVDGPQIAIVTGPEGEEIYCDEHGRIKVWFPWDRYSAQDEHSSCWIRVSQNWAGGTWGHIAIPRIGHEVIVDYLEGDIDQPIITGRTYHATNKSPYPLPDHKTKMVIRSDTHKGTGFNEFSFEDEAGKENIALHAQKDQTLKVLNNRMKRVDNDQVESVGSNKSIEVGNNHQERIGGSMNLTVGGGKAGLFGGLASVLGQATKDALNVASEAGNPMIPAFLGGAVASVVGGEVVSNPAIGSFDDAGSNRAIAGADQVGKGTALGELLSSVMPMSGIQTTIIEKFQSNTIGIARTEQIGAFKNTMVGGVQNIMVGAKQFTKIGVEQRLNVGKTKTADIGEEYTTHSGLRSAHSSGKLYQIMSEDKFEGTSKVWEIKVDDTLLLSAPGGYIEINKSGVKIRGLKVEVEGNAIDFKSGGPGEGSKCLRAMAASATPFVR